MQKLPYGIIRSASELGEPLPIQQIHGPPLKQPVPADVQEIIKYTNLREKHKMIDDQLRSQAHIPLKGSINPLQMEKLLEELRKTDQNKANSPLGAIPPARKCAVLAPRVHGRDGGIDESARNKLQAVKANS